MMHCNFSENIIIRSCEKYNKITELYNQKKEWNNNIMQDKYKYDTEQNMFTT